MLIQLVNNVTPLMKLPEWAGSFFLVLLLIGFPVALIFAWINELKAPLGDDGVAARAANTRMDFMLVGALVVVIGLVSYQQLAPPGPRTVQQASVIPAASPMAPLGVISVAVLPFVNLSSDKEQEFFSDGMTEEITSALAKIPNMRVVARTSAFQFKGQNQDMRAVGQALSATHLIEGSVRKDGNEVRITAQLIKVDDGTHLWTESYNRELKGVFALQEEIASSIAGALQVPLGLKQGDTLVSNRTDDLDSYDQYLRAKALRRVGGTNIAQAIKILEIVVARDPGFAPAWGLLASAYVLLPTGNTRAYRSGSLEEARLAVQSTQDKGEKAAREAIRLDSKNATAYYVLASIQRARGNWLAAEDLYRQALPLDANDADSINSYGNMLANVGRLKEALRLKEQARTLEPFEPTFRMAATQIMQLSGQSKATIPIIEAIRVDFGDGNNRNILLAMAYAAEGRYADAADTLLLIPTANSMVSRQSVEDAARLLRTAPAKAKTPEVLPALVGELNFVYAYVGALNRILEYPERVIQFHDVGRSGIAPLWHPRYAPMRKTERFKALMRNVGLVDYWRARGWPDLCHPVSTDDFVCD